VWLENANCHARQDLPNAMENALTSRLTAISVAIAPRNVLPGKSVMPERAMSHVKQV
jgi:hypothetical protein